jgi:hypothetical protein
MCCDFRFNVSRFLSDRNSADMGMVTKRAPVTGAQAAATLCCNGDADVYSLEFNPNAQQTPQQKVVAASSLLLIDYMFFDGQLKKWDLKDNTVYCYFCYCSILGQLVPCQICIPLGNN